MDSRSENCRRIIITRGRSAVGRWAGADLPRGCRCNALSDWAAGRDSVFESLPGRATAAVAGVGAGAGAALVRAGAPAVLGVTAGRVGVAAGQAAAAAART